MLLYNNMSTETKSNFNEKITRLESIYNEVKNLDQNNLDELIKLYQEGLLLSKELEQDINNFELKITNIQNFIDKDAKEVLPQIEQPHTAVTIASSIENDAIVAQEVTNELNKPQEASQKPLSKKYIADLFSNQDEDE